MTDIYIRRADDSGHRRRALLLVIGAVVVILGAVFLIRGGCSSEPDLEETAQAVENDPLVDELIRSTPARSAANTDAPAGGSEQKAPQDSPRAAGGPDAGPQLLARARALHQRGSIDEARQAAVNVLEASRDPEALDGARALIGEINVTILTTPSEMPEKVEYTVESGDSLAKLAKKFGTTVELIRAGNDVSGSMIRVGDRLRIFTGSFDVRIDKSENLLDLYLNDTFFKRYRVGTGEYSRTPEGQFTITDRIAQPTWWKPDGKAIPYGSPDNQLGTHWLSLNIRGYGIHGTWEPDTIGRQSSAGCIRLLNENIEELFTLLPVGTPVTIQD